MEAHVRNIRQILNYGDQWLVPFFQRHYSWEKKHWETLLADIVDLTQEEGTEHFLGPLVCTPFHPTPCVSPQHLLIDGQQRLMTISLALAALTHVCRLAGLKDLADEIDEDHLVFKRRSDQGILRLRVVPRAGQDRDEYHAAISGTASGTTESRGIAGAYSYFKRQWKLLGADKSEDVAKRYLFAMTSRLCLVVITITADRENPYEIFESLNTKNLPLEDSDVIRNFVFMQVPLDAQETFEQNHWQPFEALFDARPGYSELAITPFYRSYLMRNGNHCRKKSTYVEFKSQTAARALKPVEQVAELRRFATFEVWLRRPRLCSVKDLGDTLVEFEALEVSKTAHPLMLNLLDRHDGQRLDREELGRCVRDFASYVIRRRICREQTRSYDRLFTDAIRAIRENPQQDLRGFWLENGWPDDDAFVPRLVEFPIYSSAKPTCRLLLEKLEKHHGHQEETDLDHPNIQIEHVMPQALGDDADGDSWRRALAHDWRTAHAKWLHTLGNLTLTGYNPTLSNSSFATKKADFAGSHLTLNKYFLTMPDWDAQAIKDRGLALARVVAGIFPRPPGGPAYLPLGPSLAEDTEELEGQTGGDEEAVLPGGGKLSILVRWSLLGVKREDQTICERKASHSIVKLLAVFIKTFGEPMKQQLTEVPVIRFRLSRSRSDFPNRSTGLPFGSLPVPGTDPVLYFCPQSGTPEKIIRLRTFISRLRLADGTRFPEGGVEVSLTPDPELAEWR